MNYCIAPNEFAEIFIFEDQHPFTERESATRQRRFVLGHTV